MVGPLSAHALAAANALEMAGAVPATLRRYVVARDGNGRITKTAAETRAVSAVAVAATDRIAQSLASGQRAYLVTRAQAGAAPEVPTSWTLQLGAGPEWPVLSATDYSGLYVAIVVAPGGAP